MEGKGCIQKTQNVKQISQCQAEKCATSYWPGISHQHSNNTDYCYCSNFLTRLRIRYHMLQIQHRDFQKLELNWEPSSLRESQHSPSLRRSAGLCGRKGYPVVDSLYCNTDPARQNVATDAVVVQLFGGGEQPTSFWMKCSLFCVTVKLGPKPREDFLLISY